VPWLDSSIQEGPDENDGDDGVTDWVQRQYGKGEIDRAGELLVPWWRGETQPDRLGQAYIIIQNWRTSHGLPLNVFQAGLRQRAKRIDPKAIIAQRLKRFSSVMNKLVREPNMKLSQMQDLGGCRAILADVATVDRLYQSYRHSERLFDTEGSLKCYDYIRHPKSDGYRGIHVVGRYLARRDTRQPWNGHRVEIQLRSRLQHAFATTVETVTTFTGTPLKFGAGPDEWRRFFSLMGSALAVREGTEPVENTPGNRGELIDELRRATKGLRVRHRLRGWTSALKQFPRKNIKAFKWLLLVLNITEQTTNVTGYANRNEASRAVEEIELSKRPELDAVLVWVNDISALQTAYPNYYADTREFLEALNIALRGGA